MIPLYVVGKLDGSGLTVTGGSLALDSLVGWAEAQRRQLPPPGFAPLVDLEIPIALEPGGRLYLSSWAYPAWEGHERRFVNRKFPLHEAQMMAGPKLRRINVGAGAQKSYRIPTQVSFPEGGAVEWWCIGDAEPLRELLACVTHLGRRRAVGRGRHGGRQPATEGDGAGRQQAQGFASGGLAASKGPRWGRIHGRMLPKHFTSVEKYSK